MMKRILLILILTGLNLLLAAQTDTAKAEIPELVGDLSCVYKQKYSAKERNHFYPFNIGGIIKIVSFRYHQGNYPIKDSLLIIDSLLETKILTKAETNTLTDILYNNFYQEQPNYGQVAQCFHPRNAILFFDKAGHLKESVLLCFQCDRHQSNSEKVNFGNACTQKMEKLRRFFIFCGLNFGTDKTIWVYPGENPEGL